MLAQQGIYGFSKKYPVKNPQFLSKKTYAQLTRAEAFLRITTLRDTVWSVVSEARLSRLARFYLVGLIDAMRSRLDRIGRGSFYVRYPASIAAAQLDMGDASITRARQELVAAGLIAIDRTSSTVDLSGYVAAADKLNNGVQLDIEYADIETAFEHDASVDQNEGRVINLSPPIYRDNLTTDNNLNKNTCTNESNVFFYRNIDELKENIQLSDLIKKELSIRDLSVDNIDSFEKLLTVVGPIAQKLLSERDISLRDCGNIWKKAVYRHGLGAINGLIVALHDPSVLKPVGWFVAFANGGGDFSRGDLTPNLSRIKAAQQSAVKAADCTRIIEANDARRNTAREIAQKVFDAISHIENEDNSINSKAYSTFINFAAVRLEENGQVRFSLDGRQGHDHYHDWKKIIDNVCSFVCINDYLISEAVVLNSVRVKEAKPLN